MKFIRVMMSVFIFTLGVSMFNLSANAEETTEDENVFYSPEFQAYVKAYKITDNGLEAITEEENNELTQGENYDDSSDNEQLTPPTLLNSKSNPSSLLKKKNIVTPMDTYFETKKFIPTTTTRYVGDPLKVTQDIKCNNNLPSCSVGYGVTYTTTVTVTYTASTGSDKALIKSALGISYATADAKSKSFTFNMKNGQIGYVAFKPYKYKKEGYFQICGNQGVGCRKTDQTGYARLPVKLPDGTADGLFYFVLTKK